MGIRRLIPDSELYAWHANALAGVKQRIDINDPQPGWYKRRLVKGGPWVPARIWLQQIKDEETGELIEDAVLCCDVNGRPQDPDDQWTWLCGQPITVGEFNYLTNLEKFARHHDDREPLSKPKEAIDLLTVPPPVFSTTKGRRK